MTAPTQQEALAMAREAGFKASIGQTDKSGKYHPNVNALGMYVPVEWIEALVALAYKRGVEDEREACADEADRWGKAEYAAEAIRNRSKT